MEYLRPDTMGGEEQTGNEGWKPVRGRGLFEWLQSLVARGMGYWNEDGEFCHTQYIPPAKEFDEGDK